MKRTTFLLSFFCILFISCNNSNNKGSLVGKWKIIEMNVPGLDEEERKQVVDDGWGIEFKKDGTCIMTGDDGGDKGTYTYDKDSKKVTVKSAEKDGGEHIYPVSWKGNNLVLGAAGGEMVLKKQ